jgi:hypothetical protein
MKGVGDILEFSNAISEIMIHPSPSTSCLIFVGAKQLQLQHPVPASFSKTVAIWREKMNEKLKLHVN